MWWEKAAYRDDGAGQAMLGAAYHLGSGRARDPVTALMWLKRAKRHYSHFADRFYEAVWAACTPEQREEAERRSQEPLAAPSETGVRQ
jgi:TPR repeat protein